MRISDWSSDVCSSDLFSAHFIASNVVPLELAFEHRHHFALIGAVLAISILLAHGSLHLRVRPAVQSVLCAFFLVALGSATMLRAHSWHSNLTLDRASIEEAPTYARAWIRLCGRYFESGGGAVRDNPFLDEAIEACSNGAPLAPYALNNPALLLVLTTIRGEINTHD